MKKVKLGQNGPEVPAIAIGCMRLAGLNDAEAERFLLEALELGANFFDHADIYGGGECEERFARALHMNAGVREKLFLQSKCGIRPDKGMYDFSRDYLIAAADGILKRLKTEYLDVLLLHRPDALAEPDEVAEAFDRLYAQGKVRWFGVSNHNPGQMALLQRAMRQKIEVNQLQLSVAHCGIIRAGLNVNMENTDGIERDGGVLDYCRLNGVTVQAWSPFQYGMFGGVFVGSEEYAELNGTLGETAEKYGLTPTGMAAAWILRHPARMQVVTGTMKTARLREICAAADVAISREDWYRIFRAAGNKLP